MEAESDSENEKFVALIDQYKVIFDKSQNPAVKEAKQTAIKQLLEKWTAISGKTLTQKSFLKKLSNLKVRSKAADGKKLPLRRWQSKLLEMTKDNDDEREALPVAAESVAGSNAVLMEKLEEIGLQSSSAQDIVDKYETSETKQLSNNQLKRVILLEQLKIVQLKRMKMERGLKTAVADGSANKIEIEYIGFDGLDNQDAQPNNF